MNTDEAWKHYGDNDPYFGVLTNPEFKGTNLTPHRLLDFFATGDKHVTTLLDALGRYGFDFARGSVLDFGCGVGRLLLPFSKQFKAAVGIDVSPGMLAECRKNCEQRSYPNIELLQSDDHLTALKGRQFNLVHSFIVLQHISYDRGVEITHQLLESVAPQGVAALHIQYAGFPYIRGTGLKFLVKRLWLKMRERGTTNREMIMNAYPLNDVFATLDSLGFGKCVIQFTKTTSGGIFIWAQRTGKFPYADVF